MVAHKARLNQWTYALYDSMRQPTASTNVNGGVTYYSYCACGALSLLTDPLGNWTSFTRDYDGNVTSASASDGFSTTYTRNNLGQVASLANTAGLNLSYTYDNQGLVTNVTGSAGTLYAAGYDDCDRLVQFTDAQGVTVTNTFDTRGRLTYRSDAHRCKHCPKPASSARFSTKRKESNA